MFHRAPGAVWRCSGCERVNIEPQGIAGWEYCALPGAEDLAAEPLPYPPGWPSEPATDPAAEIPDMATAPLGKCHGCRFTAPLNTASLCGRCAHQRQIERALRGAA
jgi:hypothetical protein